MKIKKHYRKAVIAVYIISVILISWLFALERVQTCDFVSINGDFQSYNVFRRILNGQTPYVDFANYIGMAPILVNLPFVAISNTFSNSLFVTTFTSSVIFCTAVFMVFYLITERLEISCFVSVFLSKFISTQILYRVLGPKYGYIYTERFKGLYTPSNSMRGARSFLPFLIVIIAIAVSLIVKKVKGSDVDYISLLKNVRPLAAAGFVTGLFMVWSNDYGVAVIASLWVIYIILQIFCYRFSIAEFAKRFALLVISTAAGAFCSMFAVTGGHISAYLSSMADTAQYQFFYFNGTGNVSVLKYIFSTAVLWLFVAVFLAFFAYALVRLIRREADNRLLYLVFIALSVVAATFVYLAGGSGHNCREPLEVYAILFIAAFGVKFVCGLFSKLTKAADFGGGVLLLAVTAFYGLQLVTFNPVSQGVYIQAFDGHSTQVKALVDAAEIVGDEQVFSTYATGLETVTGQFQPTGYDYIIHALGKDVQQEYAQNFVDGEYKYVHTSSLTTESWIATQNWYFYRHLLPHYTQIFKTEYGWLWTKGGDGYIDAEVKVEIHPIDESSVKIVCTSDNPQEFVADVRINYTTQFANPFSRLLSLGRTAAVAYTGCIAGGQQASLAMPGSSDEYIPVYMNGGYGQAVVTAGYGDGILLDVQQAEFISAVPALDFAKAE